MAKRRRPSSLAARSAYPDELNPDELVHHFMAKVVPAEEWDDPQLDLAGTPQRFARMWGEELLSGYQPDALQALTQTFRTFPNPNPQSQLIVLSPIAFSTVCAHHMLPFTGHAHVGYIPARRIAGLSKIPRVVDHFARRLQIQERLGEQIADFLVEHLRPKGLIVRLDAEHHCMSLRGVRKSDVITRTVVLRGVAAKYDSVKAEFASLIGR
jgi:GTP cyclohydrolase I